MKDLKHTKGEWLYEGGDNNSIDIVLQNLSTISVDRHARYGNPVAVCSREEMEANAKLIVAAPKLLKALINLLENGRSDENKRDAREVIEKATK